MKKLVKLIILGLATLMFTHAASAVSDRGSAEEATALVKKAIGHLKANGSEKAYADFSNPNGSFKDRDLYIFVIDNSGKMLAHGANAKLIGKDVIELKDTDDKKFIKTFIEVANTKKSGWIDYKWTHPVSKNIEQKSTYVEKYEDVLVGCGIYK